MKASLERPVAELEQALVAVVGREHVSSEPAARAFMGQDLWAQGAVPDLVVAPGSTEEMSKVAALIARDGRALLPRGGGMSYTMGYVGADPKAVVVDARRMARILEINPLDMYVRVEAGATWAALDAALRPHGLRTPFWGPLSGIASTIGGALSQHAALFGAGTSGSSAESVISLVVVLADGAIVRTGTGGIRDAAPFFRYYGPDIAGLFLGDAGAFGLKAEATLRLMRRPAVEDYASFAFDGYGPLLEAMTATAREGLACELFGFDPALARMRMRRASLLADAKTLSKVVAHQPNLLRGVVEGARMALAGRSFLEDAYSLHVVCEGRSQAAVAADLDRVREIAVQHGGRTVENTIPKAIRAQPFTPLNNVLGPSGERWAPVHGIVPLSKAVGCCDAVAATFEARRAALERYGVEIGYMYTTVSTNGFLIEPVFFWPEARFVLHEATVEAPVLAKLATHAPNPDASACVKEARAAVIDTLARSGAAHFQVGRTYPYRANREPASWVMLEAIKQALDPEHRMNPGSLGIV